VKNQSPKNKIGVKMTDRDGRLSAATISTKHAKQRGRQRNLSPFLLDLVMDFGKCVHDHKGCERYYFDKRAKRRLRSYVGRQNYRKLEDALDVFVVVANGHIVTAGPQYERVWNS
jgi:hypothetical protein